MKRALQWLFGLKSQQTTSTKAKTAVLVDFENVSAKMLEAAVIAVNTAGPGCIFKAYGAKDRLKGPAQRYLTTHGATLVLGHHLTPGKNGSDLLLAMDAIELFHLDKVREFVLVTSDSDFAPLCDLIRTRGGSTVVIGSLQTGASLQQAASDFIQLPSKPDSTPTTVLSTQAIKPGPEKFLDQICLVTADLTDTNPERFIALSKLGTTLQQRGYGRAKDNGYPTLVKAVAADKRLVLERKNHGQVRLSQSAAQKIRLTAQRATR